MLSLEQVDPTDVVDFRHMAEAYWQELMPHASVLKDADQRDAYFRDRFTWQSGNRHPYWAIVEGRRIGFLSFAVYAANKSAIIEDFYVLPEARRRGYGGAMVQALSAHLDKLGVELIELNVRRDNPEALAFWEAQGFRVALYCLRQYRDPKTGAAFVGALSSDFAC